MTVELKDTRDDVAILINGTYSAAFKIPRWAVFAGAYFPAMDDGDIGLEISLDAGSNYYPVLDPSDGADAVLCASGADAGFVDFSDFIRFIPRDALLRFTCASQTSAAVTTIVMFRG